jgi:hypothetical protein
MDIRATLANQAGPAVLGAAFDADGLPTDDLTKVASGEVLIPQLDGSVEHVDFRCLLNLGAPVSIRP